MMPYRVGDRGPELVVFFSGPDDEADHRERWTLKSVPVRLRHLATIWKRR